jgi:hypothetical protein
MNVGQRKRPFVSSLSWSRLIKQKNLESLIQIPDPGIDFTFVTENKIL